MRTTAPADRPKADTAPRLDAATDPKNARGVRRALAGTRSAQGAGVTFQSSI
ncbi:hypothetical protein [Streptomyces acidiscabies]|uniref:hypothetical protein n=1 Tax=Streptomyces acidiscabies TaxID=42234 RepID=UPI0038F71D9E